MKLQADCGCICLQIYCFSKLAKKKQVEHLAINPGWFFSFYCINIKAISKITNTDK